ncbi:MAG: hypothetical protein IKR13_00505, partial [Victivallales bacterium]|nr:hypothetical protein [Victivallales bacterium]
MTKRLILLFALVTTLGLLADKLSDIQNALDSPSRITFTSASGSFTKESKYSNDHIGNWDTGKKETVYPASGSNFLRMKGGSKSA